MGSVLRNMGITGYLRKIVARGQEPDDFAEGTDSEGSGEYIREAITEGEEHDRLTQTSQASGGSDTD